VRRLGRVGQPLESHARDIGREALGAVGVGSRPIVASEIAPELISVGTYPVDKAHCSTVNTAIWLLAGSYPIRIIGITVGSAVRPSPM